MAFLHATHDVTRSPREGGQRRKMPRRPAMVGYGALVASANRWRYCQAAHIPLLAFAPPWKPSLVSPAFPRRKNRQKPPARAVRIYLILL